MSTSTRATHQSLGSAIQHADCTDTDCVCRCFVPRHCACLCANDSQIFAGLAYIHDRCGVAHRDLKPANCLLFASAQHCSGWRLKLADFGISKRIELRASLKASDGRNAVLKGDIYAHRIDAEPTAAHAGYTHTLGVGTEPYQSPELCGVHYGLSSTGGSGMPSAVVPQCSGSRCSSQWGGAQCTAVAAVTPFGYHDGCCISCGPFSAIVGRGSDRGGGYSGARQTAAVGSGLSDGAWYA